jgi:hypothetical protein
VATLIELSWVLKSIFGPNGIKSSQVNTLPKAKMQNPQQVEQGHAQMQQCV